MRNRRSLAARRLAFAAVAGVGLSSAVADNVPIAVTGWNQDIVAETNLSSSATSAFDLPGKYAFYAANSNAPAGGLPISQLFTSAANSATVFQLQSYSQKNALLYNSNGSYPINTTGTLTLSTQTTLSTLAVLESAANGATTFSYSLNFVDGTSYSAAFQANDWFNNTPYAIAGVGRASLAAVPVTNYSSYDSNNPRLYEYDLTVPLAYNTKLLKSVTFNQSSGAQAAIFAISGAVNPAGTGTVTWQGNASSTWDSTTPNWKGPTVFTNGSAARFDDTATTGNVVVAAGGVTPASTNFNNSAVVAYNVSGGPITGYGGLNVTGGGTVTLNSVQTYEGTTNVSNGTLVLSNAGGIQGSAGSTTVIVGTAGSLTKTAFADLGYPGTLNLTVNGSADINGAIVSTLAGSGTINLPNAGNQFSIAAGNFTGQLTGPGPVQFFNGTTTLTKAGTYTGGTTLSAGGIAVLNNPAALGMGPLTFVGGGIASGSVALTGSNAVTNSYNAAGLTVSGPLAVELSGAGTLNNSAGPVSAVVTCPTLTLSGTVGGSAALNVSGTGLVILSGANTFTGGLIVNGQVQINSQSSLPGSATMGQNSTLTINDNTGLAGTRGTLTMFGQTNYPATLRGIDNATDTFGGPIALGFNENVTGGTNGTLRVTNVLSGVNGSIVRFSSLPNSTTILSAPATYSGITLLASPTLGTTSTLQLGVDNALPAGVEFNSSGSVGNSVLDLHGFNLGLGTLRSTNVNDGITNRGAGPSVLTLQPAPSSFVNYYAGTISDGGPGAANTLSLFTNGPSGQVLAGVNTYTGGTRIVGPGGLLLQSPAAAGTGPITLSGGGVGLGLGYRLNGGATLNAGGGIVLTDGQASEARSAFLTAPQTITNADGFKATFAFTSFGGGADGVAFVIQNDPRGMTALGETGGNLGYAGPAGNTGITRSVAVELNIYSGASGGVGTALGFNGSVPGTYTSVSPVVLTSNTTNISLTYVNKVLTEQITDGSRTFVKAYNVDLESVLGGTTAYVGFTGASGGIASYLSVGQLSFNSGSAAVYANDIVVAPGSASDISIDAATTGNNARIGNLNIGSGSSLSVTANPTATLPDGRLVVGSVSLHGPATISTYYATTALLGPLNDNGISSPLKLQPSGAISLTAPATSFFSGTLVTITGTGVVNLNASFALGAAAAVSVGTNSNLNVNAPSEVASLVGTGTVILNSALTVSPAGRDVFPGTVATGGSLGSLTKFGAGTLVLTGDDTGTSPITVGRGTLELDLIFTGAAPITVNAGGTLTGSGSDPALVRLIGDPTAYAVLTPGTSGTLGAALAILTAGSAYFGDYSDYAVDLSGNSSDRLIVGALTLASATSELTFNGAPDGGSTYTLVSYQSLAGRFAVTPNLPAGYVIDYGTGVNSSITLTRAVPEPLSLGWLIAAGLLGRRGVMRRRNSVR